jgi:hypothetical protein
VQKPRISVCERIGREYDAPGECGVGMRLGREDHTPGRHAPEPAFAVRASGRHKNVAERPWVVDQTDHDNTVQVGSIKMCGMSVGYVALSKGCPHSLPIHRCIPWYSWGREGVQMYIRLYTCCVVLGSCVSVNSV